MRITRYTMLLLASLALPWASPVEAAKVPACTPDRWVVETPEPVITPPGGQVTGGEIVEYTDPGRNVPLVLSSCRPITARIKGAKSGTQVVAHFPAGTCPGITGPLRLRATIIDNCTRWTGTIKYPKQRKQPFTANLSRC